MNEVYRLISDITRARQRVFATLYGFSAKQGAFRLAAGGWSIAETVEHLVLAEQLGSICCGEWRAGTLKNNPREIRRRAAEKFRLSRPSK